MAQYFEIHRDNPQHRLLQKAADLLLGGELLAVPTDASYVLIAPLGNKQALDHLRRIRQIDDKQLLSIMCRDLSEIATYAKINNHQYRQLRSATPGPYVFILEATREVPRKLAHPSRKTVGLRIPDHPATLALIECVGEPVIASTLQLPQDDFPMTDPEEILERLDKLIGGVVACGHGSIKPSTVLDMTEVPVRLVRQGQGDLSLFPELEET